MYFSYSRLLPGIIVRIEKDPGLSAEITEWIVPISQAFLEVALVQDYLLDKFMPQLLDKSFGEIFRRETFPDKLINQVANLLIQLPATCSCCPRIDPDPLQTGFPEMDKILDHFFIWLAHFVNPQAASCNLMVAFSLK